MPDADAIDASAGVDAGDVPICPSPSPMEGSPCTAGDGCWIPASPCFFVYRCEDSMWSPRTICPSLDAGL
jgi:hypothetical protein